MHYHCEVYLENCKGYEDAERQISEIMAPYYEELYDWFEVGGRWTGEHTRKYDPMNDPRNYKICRICKGTGIREDWAWVDKHGKKHFKDKWAEQCNGCNGCDGTGQSLKWHFKPFAGDVIKIEDVRDDLCCHTLIVEGKIYDTQKWNNKSRTFEELWDGNVKNKLKELGKTKGFIVTVDYHN